MSKGNFSPADLQTAGFQAEHRSEAPMNRRSSNRKHWNRQSSNRKRSNRPAAKSATRPAIRSTIRSTPNATTYQLIIDVPAPLRIAVGRLGQFSFPAGKYCYTGPAKTNLEARVARHLRREKKLRWHIDYLLCQRRVRVIDVVRHNTPECTVNQQVTGRVVAAKFGASDCKSGCISHLKLLHHYSRATR